MIFYYSNLYAIDYLKIHPNTTPAEFKTVFAGLDEDTIKVMLK